MPNQVKFKFFKYIYNSLHFVQVSLIFLSFFCVLYWLLDLAQLQIIKPVAPFFETIRSITQIFYNNAISIGESKIDFSFLLASIFMIFCTWIIKLVIEYIEIIEEKYKKINYAMKKEEERKFNLELEKEYLNETYKNNKAIIGIKFSAKNKLYDKFYSRGENENLEDIQKEVLKKFYEAIESELYYSQEIDDEKIIFITKKFDDINKTITLIDSEFRKIKYEYIEKNIEIDAIICLDAYGKNSEIDYKTKKLKSLINTGVWNEMLCFGSFKERYNILRIRIYKIETYGTYLILGENEEIERIKSLN